MTLSKKSLLGFVFVFITPFVGLLFSFSSMSYKKNKLSILSISLFTVSFIWFVPPYQDLYRRFYETYFVYNDSLGLLQAIYGHVDFLFYLMAYFFKINNIPFFIIPVIAASTSVYLFLTSLSIIFERSRVEIESSRLKIAYFIAFCFVNIIVIALGIRFGWAAAISIYGVVALIFEKKYLKGYSILIIATTLHFSMILIIMAVVFSRFFRVKRSKLVLFCIILISFSNLILPIVISHITIFGIDHYAQNGYVDGKFAAVDTTLNSLIVAGWRYVLAIFMIYIYCKSNKNPEKELKDFENFIFIYICISCCTFMSYIAFNRYITEIGLQLYVLLFLSSIGVYKKLVLNAILILSIINLLFNNIYLQRRPIALGEMWRGIYTPVILRYNYSEQDFERYLTKIDSAGDWIGHELKSNQQ